MEIRVLFNDSNSTVWSEGARIAPQRPLSGRWVEGGHHAIVQAARGRSRGQCAALEGRAQTCWTWTWTWTWVGEFWWFEKRSAQSVVVRNAMPPLGDTDGAGGRTEVCSRLHLDDHAPRRAEGPDQSFE